MFDRHLLFPDYNADQLRLKLLQTFSSLNDKLVDWDENSILSSWSDDYQFVSDQYGIADALLYGQIVRFLTNEEFSTLISSHEQIMKYFEHLNNRYFVSIDIHDSIEPYWNVSYLSYALAFPSLIGMAILGIIASTSQ